MAQKYLKVLQVLALGFVVQISSPRNEVYAENHRAIIESDQLITVCFKCFTGVHQYQPYDEA
jgi:hypothetical protein